MATGSLTVSITIPSIDAPANGVAAGASSGLAATLLAQVLPQISAPGAPTSGNIVYPPGAAQQVVGSWEYTPAT